MTFLEPSFPGNEKDATDRQSHVAELIRDFWPHRMSAAAAESIDNYYLRLAANSAPKEYQPKHRKDAHD